MLLFLCFFALTVFIIRYSKVNEQCGNRREAVVVLYNVYNELSCQSIDLKTGQLVQSLTVLHKCGYHLVINTQDKPMEALHVSIGTVWELFLGFTSEPRNRFSLVWT